MALWTARIKDGPEPRYLDAAACVAVGHKLYCFGSAESESRIGVRVFDTVSLSWTQPRVTASPGADIPRLRIHLTAVLIGHTVYLWGGYRPRGAPRYPNDLYAFDVDTHVWFKPEVSGSAPEKAWFHYAYACALDEVMYILGGRFYASDGLYLTHKDVYALNTRTMTWSLLTAKGPAPLYDGPSRAAVMGTKIVAISWGCVRAFDTTTNLWNVLSSGIVPSMCRHSPFVYNGELYAFGRLGTRGRDDVVCLLKSNLHTTCTPGHPTCTWKRVTTRGIKSPQGLLSRSFLVQDRVVVFGTDFLSEPLHTFVLDLSPSLKTLSEVAVTRHGLPQLELPRELRRELEAMNAVRTNADGN